MPLLLVTKLIAKVLWLLILPSTKIRTLFPFPHLSALVLSDVTIITHLADECKIVSQGCFNLYSPDIFSMCSLSFVVSSTMNCKFVSFAQFLFGYYLCIFLFIDFFLIFWRRILCQQ